MRNSEPYAASEVFLFWNKYYWISIWAVIGGVILIHTLTHHPADLRCDLYFAAWTALLHLAASFWPYWARIAHAVSVLPFLAYYFSVPDTLVAPNKRDMVYIMLSFFPIYTVSAMSGALGGIVTITIATIAGYRLLAGSSESISLAPLYWGLAAMIGHAHYALTSRLQKRYDQLTTQALSDPLTNLGNRRAMEQDYARYRDLAQREGKRLYLTLWDINDLKKINDLHGHSAGDNVLRKFARAVTDSARRSDPFYRIGGDEFAGLHIGIEDPNEFIRRIRDKIPWVSAGWSDATQLSFEEAYEKADQNMYNDKLTKPRDPSHFEIEQ